MLLKRVVNSLRSQDWTTVTVELVSALVRCDNALQALQENAAIRRRIENDFGRETLIFYLEFEFRPLDTLLNDPQEVRAMRRGLQIRRTVLPIDLGEFELVQSCARAVRALLTGSKAEPGPSPT